MLSMDDCDHPRPAHHRHLPEYKMARRERMRIHSLQEREGGSWDQ
jgi:hypothetical protein